MELTVITGAGSGIGRALTLSLADRGLHVLGVGRRLAPLEETRAFLPEKIRVVSADVSTEDGRAAIISALPEGARVRYLVHNAAVLGPVAPLSRMPLEGWRHHMAVNLEGPLFLTQALLPHMPEGSRILHISSGAAHAAYQGWGAYCTSKAAFHMLYRCLDGELVARGIRVGSIRPGVVDTPMQDEVRCADPKVFPNLPRFQALKADGNLVAPGDVARFLSWFLLDTEDQFFAEVEQDMRDMREADGGWRPA